MTKKYHYRPLNVVQTPIVIELLEGAKLALSTADYNFAAEVKLAEKRHHDPSVVVRRAIRDFWHMIGNIHEDRWVQFFNLYAQHGGTDALNQYHFRIHEDDRVYLDRIRDYIRENSDILRVVNAKREELHWMWTIPIESLVPNSFLVIAALSWEIERLSF